ncbi:carboxylesterase 4A-like isoform X1 [Lingula anatina]|uniref:Carboxylesterase 4A-like isoform X1 n=1 Tax=Lingula anatina TaxID=7574 RepID=A0A1S3I7Q0_LINAN|nr:carboxylesterase 4A-like isoform X1 [Lingula anatina]|eukprot:XP_013394223.1 carboxylesterase 4A-like isoform X1 [Lingula anatina]
MQRPNPFGFPNPKKISEDCLTLNVFVPDTPGVKAVMVWIHGGGYYTGGSFHYDFTEFAARGDIIVVSLNYRLGPFGFLSIDGANAPGNLGLWDQIEGLKWVQNNIGAFGGDPKKVTTFGESAGGSSISQLALTAKAKGLFHRFIPQSGSAWADWTWSTEKAATLSLRIGDILGCHAGETERSKLLDCLRKTTAERFLDASIVATIGVPGTLHYSAEVDGDMFPESLSDMFKKPDSELIQHFRSLDCLGGFTDGDGAILIHDIDNGITPAELRDKFIPDVAKHVAPGHKAEIENVLVKEYYNNAANRYDTANRYVDILTDWDLAGPMAILTDKHVSPGGGSTYLYYLTKAPSFGYVLKFPPWFDRSNHGDDISYLLGPDHPTMFDDGVEFDDGDKRISYEMMKYWANFAKTGDPNKPDIPTTTWPPYTSDKKEYIELGDVTKSASNVIPSRWKLWVTTIPEIQASPVVSKARGRCPPYLCHCCGYDVCLDDKYLN